MAVYHRWGVRIAADPDRETKNETYLQTQYDDDNTIAKAGELFLNEELETLYYVDQQDNTAKRVLGSVPFSKIDFTGLREFDDDTAAAAASPAVPVGGMYRTGSVLKVRVV